MLYATRNSGHGRLLWFITRICADYTLATCLTVKTHARSTRVFLKRPDRDEDLAGSCGVPLEGSCGGVGREGERAGSRRRLPRKVSRGPRQSWVPRVQRLVVGTTLCVPRALTLRIERNYASAGRNMGASWPQRAAGVRRYYCSTAVERGRARAHPAGGSVFSATRFGICYMYACITAVPIGLVHYCNSMSLSRIRTQQDHFPKMSKLSTHTITTVDSIIG